MSAGCVVATAGPTPGGGGPTTRALYAPCTPGDACVGLASCQAAGYAAPGAVGASFCTVGCSAGAACPSGGACVLNPTTSQGQCYATCRVDTDCAGLTICAPIAAAGSATVCVPGTRTAPTCGASGQACCAGGVCGAGLSCAGGVCAAVTPARDVYAPCTAGESCAGATTCMPSAYTVTGGTGSLCTTACTASTLCPSPASGLGASCVLTSGVGQCLPSCASNADCRDGTRCTVLPTSPAVQACVPIGAGSTDPCGASGQACCAGNACASGLSCVSGVCRPALPVPYQSCTPAGATCAGGATCMQAQVRAPGSAVGNLCTAACPSGLASACPAFVAGQVECVNLPGDMQFQCMRLCNAQGDCAPYGTQCLQVVTKTGNTVRVCAP